MVTNETSYDYLVWMKGTGVIHVRGLPINVDVWTELTNSKMFLKKKKKKR